MLRRRGLPITLECAPNYKMNKALSPTPIIRPVGPSADAGLRDLLMPGT